MTATSLTRLLTPARLLLALLLALTPLLLQPPKAVQAAYCANFTFAAATNFGVGSQPYSVAVGDFNGDGHPDLASAIFDSNQVSVRLGNGDGTFEARQDFGVGNDPSSVTVGDFNGDGREDLATAYNNRTPENGLVGAVSILINIASVEITTYRLTRIGDEMERRGLGTGLVNLCVGAGMGTATIIERM